MTAIPLNIPLAESSWRLALHPAFNGWALLVGGLVAAALAVHLYRAQQEVAPPRLVRWLTVIRLLLIGLVLLVLASPALRFTHTRTIAGSLWLLLDASKSMGVADPQSTPVERLRWADALGELPKDARPGKLDRSLAELTCLQEDLRRLGPSDAARGAGSPPPTPAVSSGGTPPAESPATPFLTSANAWKTSLDGFLDALTRDAKVRLDGAEVVKRLQTASALLGDGAAKAAARKTARLASLEVPWPTIFTNLDAAASGLRGLADAADADFLTRHGNDPAVRDALARVGKLSRGELATLALTRRSSLGSTDLSRAMPGFRTRIASFAEASHALPPVGDDELPTAIKKAMTPGGAATDLSAGLRTINEQLPPDAGAVTPVPGPAATRPREPREQGDDAAVLVLSDGRQNTGTDPAEAARVLASRGARVYSLAVGSNHPIIDAAVEAVDAPEAVFKDDTVKATASVRLDGLAGRPVTVEFRRFAPGDPPGPVTLLDTKTLTASRDAEVQRVTFQDKPPGPGRYEYDIRAAALPGELNTANNRQGFGVAVKKDKLAILVIEDQPRWEYRYLVNTLSRDDRVKLQTVLLSPAMIDKVTPPAPVKASPGNPRQEAQILPATKEEWSAFDLIVLGDVPREALAAADQEAIVAAVKDRGTALVVIAGARNMPARFLNTPLAAALPVGLSDDWQAETVAGHLKAGFRVAPTAEGAASILSQVTLDPEQNAKLWDAAPAWYWHAEQTRAKPSATVVLTIADAPVTAAAPGSPPIIPGADADDTDAARRRALLATMSLGQGRVMYLASDQTWRLRQVAGENLHDRFWGQVVRWAVGSDLPAGNRFVRFGADKPRYAAGDTVTLSARLLKQDLMPLHGAAFKAVAKTVAVPDILPTTNPSAAGAAGSAGPAPTTAASPTAGAMAEPRVVGQADFVERADAPGYYRATLAGLPPGVLEFSLEGAEVERLLGAEPSSADAPIDRTLRVRLDPRLDVEDRDLNTDRPTLARVSQAGGGFLLDGPYADILAAHLPRTERRQTSVEQLGFFADPENPTTRKTHLSLMIAFFVLITAEWVVRKRAGLV